MGEVLYMLALIIIPLVVGLKTNIVGLLITFALIWFTRKVIIDFYKRNNKSYILVGEADKIGTQILFILDDKAVIKNKYNQVIAFEDLKVGLNIK